MMNKLVTRVRCIREVGRIRFLLHISHFIFIYLFIFDFIIDRDLYENFYYVPWDRIFLLCKFPDKKEDM